jgi:hypothetical protein
VTTSRGASAPLPGFTYRGLGQLRTSQVVQAAPFIHRPRALLVSGDDLLLDSALLGAVVRVGDAGLLLPHLVSVPPAVGGGAVFWVAEGGLLHRRDLASAEVTDLDVSARVPDWLGYLHPASGPDLLVAIGRDLTGTWITGHDPATLAVVLPPAPFPYVLETAPLDLGDGRLVAAARPDSGADPLLYAFTPSGVASPLPVAGVIGPSPTPGAVCTAGQTSRGATAAVGLSDGAVQAVPFVGPGVLLPARSATPVAALALSGDVLVVARTADGTVVGTDLVTGATWGLTLDRPTRLASAGGLVWVASDASDALTAVDGATGQVLARRADGVSPGSDRVLGGAAWLPGDPGAGVEPSVLSLTASPGALVDWRLGLVGPTGVPLDLTPTLVVADAAAGRTWVAGGATLVARQGPTELLRATLPSPAVMAVATAGGLLVAHQDGLAFVDEAGVHPLLAGGTFPTALEVASDGRALYAATVLGEDRLLVFAPSALPDGGAPTRDEPVPGLGSGAAWVDGQAWAFFLDASFARQAAPLEGAGFGAPVERLGGDGDGLVSPNGRTRLTWGAGPLGGEVLHVWSLDPALAFGELTSVSLGAALGGLAFDASGERLYVVTRGPDRLLVLQ